MAKKTEVKFIMIDYYNNKFPNISDLQTKARKKIPKFAYDYLVGGCIDEISVKKNIRDIENVELRSEFLKPTKSSSIEVELFGKKYSAPFGVAPIGLQGLMWPKAPEILAKAAKEKNIPYILSTVSSASLEKIAEISEGNAWFQLYNPSKEDIRIDLLKRIKKAEYPVLVVTVDVPTFGYRPRDIKNGLSMPPKMSPTNIFQMIKSPNWLYNMSKSGKPELKTLLPYMPEGMSSNELADFMNKTVMGSVDLDGLKPIRDMWQGPLVIKGLINQRDVQKAIELGADGVIISNHGGRQLDVGESPIKPLKNISEKYGNQIKIMMDSGLRSGSNIASALALGAEFTFLGRSFVYGVSALGEKGAYHTINLLKTQLEQVMAQLGCENIHNLRQHLVEI